MGGRKGDFIGFTFDDIHSSELGLIRVSGGNRFSENLLPSLQDKTVQIPGGDGYYYFGSNYTQRQFSISVAFDSLTEDQIRLIKKKFGDRKIHKLVFDELPYKYYLVKVSGAPNLKYIPFDEEECSYHEEYVGSKEELYSPRPDYSLKRVYKGEGSITFVAYNPFGRSRFKYRDQYNVENCPELEQTGSVEEIFNNFDAWVTSSGFKGSTETATLNGKTYTIDVPTLNGVAVYNPGDFEAHFKLKFDLRGNVGADGKFVFPGGKILAPRDSETAAKETKRNNLELNSFSLQGNDTGIRINTALNLIEGLNSSGVPTGNLYNKYIKAGDFFKIPILDELCLMQFELNTSSLTSGNLSIEYDYLFF